MILCGANYLQTDFSRLATTDCMPMLKRLFSQRIYNNLDSRTIYLVLRAMSLKKLSGDGSDV